MSDNNEMLGIGGIGLLVILFFLMSGNGFGFGNNNQVATSNEVQRGFDNQNSMANQREILGSVNQSFHDTLGALDQRYNELTRDIGALQVAQAQALANQNECCCSTKLMLTEQNAQLNSKMDAGFAALREKMDANKIEALQAQINQLQLQNQLAGVIRYPTQATWSVQPPFPAPFPPVA